MVVQLWHCSEVSSVHCLLLLSPVVVALIIEVGQRGNQGVKGFKWDLCVCPDIDSKVFW